MKSFKVLRQEIKNINKETKDETKKIFKKEIGLLKKQEKFLYEFLFNINEEQLGNIEGNQLFFLINLFSDSLQQTNLIRELIIVGKYNAAGTLLRNLFETMLLIEHLQINTSDWRDWLEYQKLSEDERENPLERPSDRLRTLIRKFTPSTLMNAITNETARANSKWTYSYLCSFPHTSMERIRRVTETTEENNFRIRYADKFINDVAQYSFNTLFTLIDSIYDFFIVAIGAPIEGTLKEYEKIRPKTN